MRRIKASELRAGMRVVGDGRFFTLPKGSVKLVRKVEELIQGQLTVTLYGTGAIRLLPHHTVEVKE